METVIELPTCAVLTCPNAADPRWYARDVNDRPVMICDGHVPMPKPSEVAARPPDPAVLDIAARIVRDGYSPTLSEVDRLAHALIADQEELAELRDLADLVSDADISALPPELLAVRQRWIAERHAKEHAKELAEIAEIEADLAARWETIKRTDVLIVRCRYCGFEVFSYADAAIVDHMKACRSEVHT